MELALRSCDSAPRPPICSSVLASGACIGREALVPATLLPPICSCALVLHAGPLWVALAIGGRADGLGGGGGGGGGGAAAAAGRRSGL
eukprot:scaffold182282_cov16-Tisochrysis_lutea.AAC.1